MSEMTDAAYEMECLLDQNFGNVVIVDNVPCVKMSKMERLTKVLRKIFSSYGEIAQEVEGDHPAYDGLWIPTITKDGKEKTAGYAMVEYKTRKDAQKAVKKGDNRELDKKHILRFNFFTDFDRFMAIPETFVEPKKVEYQTKANLTNWLLDPFFRDQFVIRYASETQIFWNDPIREVGNDGRILQYGGERQRGNGKTWTDGYVEWSPKGNYLVTHHDRGIALWGGDTFEKLGRFGHNHVKVIAFSPNEKYLITCNGQAQNDRDKDPPCLIVWEVCTGTILRPFEKQVRPSDWPVFHWSHDDKYLARVQVLVSKKQEGIKREVISVYELPGMNLVNKKSMDVPGVREVMWSPSDNILSYWVPELGDVPARVGLVEFPSQKKLREMHIYSVEDICMHWQNAGDYLCIKIERKKTKKTPKATNFEIVRMRSKLYPVEVLEIQSDVIAFTWEPDGHRFAVIHGTGNRPDVSFWTLKKRKLTLLKTLKERVANSLYWQGNTVVLAGLGAMNGALTFVETTTFEILHEAEHFMCNDIEWDSSGRYVITSVVAPLGNSKEWRYSMENGYKVWNAQGQNVANVRYPGGESCYRVAWRPRPKTLLDKKQIGYIKKNLKEKYWRRFEQEDQELKQRSCSAEERNRLDMKNRWKSYREKRKQEHKLEASLRQELRKGLLSDDEDNWDTAEEAYEEEIEATMIDD